MSWSRSKRPQRSEWPYPRSQIVLTAIPLPLSTHRWPVGGTVPEGSSGFAPPTAKKVPPATAEERASCTLYPPGTGPRDESGAIRGMTMPTLEHGLTPYVPRLALDWLRTTPERRWQVLEGSLALVDVSGFTALSERLASRGRIGAEELTDVIGSRFADLLAVVDAEGGSLLKFGGDALLLFFPGDEQGLTASRAALGMRAALQRVARVETSAGPVTLRVSIGVHAGTVHAFLVGPSHRELVIAGPGVSETVAVEAAAQAGEVRVSHTTVAGLPGDLVARADRRQGRALRTAAPVSNREPTSPPERHDDLARVCVPAALRDYLDQRAREPEHRLVTVAFLRFSGTDELIARQGPATAADAVESVIDAVQHAAEAHSVAFLATDVDRDASKIILAAGAPSSGGNDEERMLLAMRELAVADVAAPLQMGVHAGAVFAGDVGPPHRRTYTVMGDVVNVAARLMSRARPGQILASDAVIGQSRTTFATDTVEGLELKGKRQRVQARLVGPAQGTRPHQGPRLPLVGRGAELEVLDRALAEARAGRGRVLELVGEPGVGKSRLVEELVERAAGFTVRQMAGEMYRAAIPYAPLRSLLRGLLGVSPGADSTVAAEHLQRVLEQSLPELLPWAPLLAIPLDADVPATPATESLSEQFRRDRLHSVTAQLLAWACREPTLLVVEDAQWLDEASADLLRALAGHAGEHAWLLCLTQRAGDGRMIPDEHGDVLTLEPLDPGAAARLADAATDDAPLPPHEMAALLERSGGNPLYLQELVAAVRAGGLGGLPDSVEALVTARIDLLTPDARALLRHVSVLGQRFSRTLVDAVAPEARTRQEVWAQLDGFLDHERDEVAFRHSLIRDAAYDGLAYRLRRRLHAAAADTIAAEDGGASELLSFHYFLAARYEAAWVHSLAAARNAASIYAHEAAARFYRRALDAAEHLEDIPREELGRTAEALGDAQERLGDFAQAGAAYRDARRAMADPVDQARLWLKHARVQARLRRFSQALGSITRGLRRIEGTEHPAAQRQRAELQVWYGHFRQAQGHHDRALAWTQAAIDAAEQADAREVLAHAYRLLDWIHLDLGQPEEAVYAERALQLYEELGDLPNQASVLNNMGGIAFWQGRWDEALARYERALELDERTGDVVGAASGRNNIGEILADQGRLEEAESLFREAERVFRAVGDRTILAHVTANLGRVAGRKDRFEEAHHQLREARRTWQEVGAEVQALEADARIAEVYVLAGDAASALGFADAASARSASRTGVAAQEPVLDRVRAYALLQLDELDEARAAAQRCLEAARARDADYELALGKRALALVAERQGTGEAAALRAESQTILDRLGVRSLPEIPGEVILEVRAPGDLVPDETELQGARPQRTRG